MPSRLFRTVLRSALEEDPIKTTIAPSSSPPPEDEISLGDFESVNCVKVAVKVPPSTIITSSLLRSPAEAEPSANNLVRVLTDFADSEASLESSPFTLSIKRSAKVTNHLERAVAEKGTILLLHFKVQEPLRSL